MGTELGVCYFVSVQSLWVEFYVAAIIMGSIICEWNPIWVQSIVGAIMYGCNYFRCNYVWVQSYLGAIIMGAIMWVQL